MKSKAIIFVTLLLLSLQSVYPQSKINISIGGGYLATSHPYEKLQYWNNGYSINFNLEYFLSDNFALSVVTSYQNFLYDESLVQLISPAVVGYRMQVDGQNSKAYELSFKAKYYLPSSSFVHPLLSVGTGFLVINQGNVVLTSWLDGNEASKGSISLSGSNNNYILGQFSVGAGVEIQIIKSINLIVEGNYVGSFNYGFTYFPITTSIKFGL